MRNLLFISTVVLTIYYLYKQIQKHNNLKNLTKNIEMAFNNKIYNGKYISK